jgi:hypothetical protein
MAALPARPWRKVHLDFHNSQHVKKIGARFDAVEFGSRLEEAAVNSIVVFAKDMHGYFYYPSKYGPVHPGLDFDLLGAQVEACRQRRIQVLAYYCVTWDNYLAAHHPEWLVIKRDGSNYLPKPDQTPGWTALCQAHEGFVQLVLDHTREFAARYPLDGVYFDMPIPIGRECYCPECVRQMRARGEDPQSREAQGRHKDEIHKLFLGRLNRLVNSLRPGCQIDFNNQVLHGLAGRVPFMNNIDLEALPTGQWGYYYFPMAVRYTRTFGLTTYGMTGRFKASWADFGGLKLPAQLDTELAAIVANGARCDVGDQAPPDGRLDPAVYRVIGESFRKIRAIEPYLEQAVPVTEAALLTAGAPMTSPGNDTAYGLTKLLMELHVQFDIVETDAAWERYGLIVLGDALPVTPAVAARIHAYIERGGAAVVCHRAGLLGGTEKTWLDRYGFEYHGLSAFKPAYMLPRVDFTGGLPPFEYALYQGASQWLAQAPAELWAQLGEPAFQRGPRQYTSHKQSPFDHVTRYAAVARSGRVALFGFPLGESYFNEGYWVYRSAFRHALAQLLPAQLASTNAPESAEVTVTHQAAGASRRERYLVHIVNFSPMRGAPKHPVFHENPVPLADISVRLRLPAKPRRARAVIAGRDLPLKPAAGGVEFVVPRILVHEIVCIEV